MSVVVIFSAFGNFTVNAASPYVELAGKLILNSGGLLENNLPGNVTASYNSSSKVLTLVLNGAELPRSECSGRALLAQNISCLNIILAEGTVNSMEAYPINSGGSTYSADVIKSTCDVNIIGSGTLNITLDTSSGTSYKSLDYGKGIYLTGGTLTIRDNAKVNVNLKVRVGYQYGCAYGIDAPNTVINKGDLSVTVANDRTATTQCIVRSTTLNEGSVTLNPALNATAGGGVNVSGSGYTKTEENGVIKYTYEHQWQYVANGNTLKYYCSRHTDCAYGGEGNAAIMTLNAEDDVFRTTGKQVEMDAIFGGPTMVDVTVSAPYSKAAISGDVDQIVGAYVPEIIYEGVNGTVYGPSATPPSEVGSYSASLTVNNNKITDGFVISMADIAYTAPQANTLEYTGEAQALITAGTINTKWWYTERYYDIADLYKSEDAGTMQYRLGTDGSWSNDVPAATENGTYTVYWRVVPLNKYASKYLSYEATEPLTVTIKGLPMTGPAASNLVIPYDGQPHGITVSGVMDGATVTYGASENGPWSEEQPQMVNVADSGNIYYKVSAVGYDDFIGSAEITITPIYIGEASVTLSCEEYVFDYLPQEPEASVILGGKALVKDTDYTVSYSNNTNAGTAKVTVTGIGNYSGEVEKEFTIKQKPVDIIWTENTFYYTGQPHYISTYILDSLGGEIAVTGAENVGNIEVGEYIATMPYICEFCDKEQVISSNLIPSEATKNHTYVIKWYDGAPEAIIGGTMGENGWYVTDVTLTAPEGYTISTAPDGAYGKELTFGNETDVVYYLKQDGTGYVARIEHGDIKVDYTAPNGTVLMTDVSTPWTDFINNVTFGLFYNKNVEISVAATDTVSGVNKIEYFAMDEALTLENVKALEGWTSVEDDGKILVTAEDALKFVYYFRITDAAGNTAFLSTDGATFDTTAPVISGIENGNSYYVTQKVTITDNNLDTVTLNGDTVSDTVVLDGNSDISYTIEATDKAGNTTTYIVTMKPVSDLSVSIDALNDDNVNSSNEQALDDVKAAIAAVDTTNATDAEKEALQEIADKAAELEKIIDDTAAENKRLGDTVDGYDPANVTTDDKADLEQLLTDIEKQLESPNLTEDEKNALENVKERTDCLIEAIDEAEKAISTENVEKVEDVNAETVTPEDKTDLENAKADLENALEENGGNYTDDEKQVIEEEINRIDDALKIIENAETVEELIGNIPENVTVSDEDTIKVAEDAYNALTDYEKSLVDEDVKKALADAKEALAELNKPVAPAIPETGDNGIPWLCFALLFVSGMGIFGITIYDRKRKAASKG